MGKIKKITFLLFITLVLWLGGFPVLVSAASLYFSPTSGSYSVGNTFSVNVFVSSASQSANATSGVISFPQDKLAITSVSKAGSVLNLWVSEPSFSNSAGTVNFEGVILNPGFTGSGGKIVTLNFKVKATGQASLSFNSSAVLANDGQGTNILTNSGSASFSLIDGQQETQDIPKTPTSVSSGGVPAAPDIKSSTHPNQNKWYAISDAKFNWDLTSDITGARLLYDKTANDTPTVVYAPPINSKEIQALQDGIWYFHAQLKNGAGLGAVSHFRFQIDTQKPSHFEITEVPRQDQALPNATFLFDAKDETSGIDHYEILIDGGKSEVWQNDTTNKYKASAMDPGKHTLVAKAVDGAGNYLTNSIDFTVEGINAPTITDYTKELQNGEPLVVHGLTYPNSTVTMWLGLENNEAKSFLVQSGSDGKFTFTSSEKLKSGGYKFWAQVKDSRGAKSLFTEKFNVSVAKSGFFIFGGIVINFLSVLIPILALLMLLIVGVWYAWHKLLLMRKRISKEVGEVGTTLHKEFNVLKKSIEQQIKLLEKTEINRELTNEEEKVLKKLKQDLTKAEKSIKKEIDDIEEVIK